MTALPEPADRGPAPADDRRLADAHLMRGVAEGDGDALESLIRLYDGAVARTIGGIVLDASAADDLVQESWLRVIARARSFEAGRPVVPWLVVIARNVAIDHLRAVRLAPEPDAGLPDAADESPSPAESAESSDQARAIRAVLARMDETDRQILALRAAGLDYDGIADALAVPKGTVRSRLSRARDTLRERLDALGLL